MINNIRHMRCRCEIEQEIVYKKEENLDEDLNGLFQKMFMMTPKML